MVYSSQGERDSQIGTLRVVGAGDNTPALRLSLRNLLETADLRPAGVSPAAVLIVRRMVDPLPGHIAPYRRPARVESEWERAAQDAVYSLYRHAARPVHGVLPSSAEAVFFADEA